MKVIIAPDKFRGSLTAIQAADAIADGIRRVIPAAEIHLIPVADGGDGTVDAAVAAGFIRQTCTVMGPTGRSLPAAWASRGTSAVVELAEASGLRRLPQPPDPLSAATSSTYGTGQLLLAALDAGAQRIVLGLGGSATTDGGTGLAEALGVRFLDPAGQPLPSGGAALLQLARIDTTRLDRRIPNTQIILATDVDNPLTGPHGAAHVYAAQKGADRDCIDVLDKALGHLADVVSDLTGQDTRNRPGAGAAGGIAATALPLLGAAIHPGSELLLELLGLPDVLDGANLVITGEGSLDEQTLRGKAPVGVARVAGAHNVPVVAVAGRIQVSRQELTAAGIEMAYSLSELEPDPVKSMSNAGALLSKLAERIAHQWLDPVDARRPG